jgi:hypothetical protein
MKTAIAKRLATALILGLSAVCAPQASSGVPDKSANSYLAKWEAIGPNVRIMRHEDGSRTEFRRSPDDRTLTKKTTGNNGYVKLVTVYRMDNNGNPRGCQIFDGKSNLLYKVSYGYHKTTGQLVAEDMFDARVKILDERTGREMPVRRMYYTYDAQGNRSKAQAFVNIKGKLAEDVYGKKTKTTYPDENPFRAEKAKAKAKPNRGSR